MAAANRYKGNNVVILWTPSGGSEVAIQGDYTEISFDNSADTTEAAAGNEVSRYPVTTLIGLDFTLNIFDATQSYLADLLPGSTGKLEVRPQGTGSGLPKFSFNAVITGYNITIPFDDLVDIEITGSRQGDMIDNFGSVQS